MRLNICNFCNAWWPPNVKTWSINFQILYDSFKLLLISKRESKPRPEVSERFFVITSTNYSIKFILRLLDLRDKKLFSKRSFMYNKYKQLVSRVKGWARTNMQDRELDKRSCQVKQAKLLQQSSLSYLFAEVLATPLLLSTIGRVTVYFPVVYLGHSLQPSQMSN